MGQRPPIETYYDFLSGLYDKATQGEHAWTPPRETERLIAPLVGKGSRVLDIGIGTGQSVGYLADKGCKVWGLDISEKMLEVTRSKYPQFHLQKAGWNFSTTAAKKTKLILY